MFTLSRLPVSRQRNVGGSLGEHFKTNPTYPPKIADGALAVIGATAALGASDEVPLFTIDVATDSVVSATYRLTQDIQKGLVESIVPLGAAQRAMLDAAIMIDQAWFPDGIGFIHDTPGLQYSAMNRIRGSLTDAKQGPAIQAAVATLGIAPLVDHLLAHIAIYAKKLKLAGEVADAEPDPADPSEVWHAAFVKLAIDVWSTYPEDPKTRDTLIGSYDRELAGHRDDQAKERKQAKKKAKAEAEKAKAEAEAEKKADS